MRPRTQRRRTRSGRFALLALGVLLAAALGAPRAPGADDRLQCGRCHGNPEFLVGKRGSPAADAALFVPDSLVAGSRHASLECRTCHRGFDAAFPHRPEAETQACESCHEEIGAEWASSVHALNAHLEGDAPTCVRCHGAHDVLAPDDRDSPVHPLNEASLCAECHADEHILVTYFTDPADSVARTAVEQYRETVHGLTLSRAGLVVTATCSSCHRPHRVLPHDVPGSSVHRDEIAGTCGACHVGVLETWQTGAHGIAYANGTTSEHGLPAPVCTDCHSAHGVASADEGWRVDVVDECVHCHERKSETYFETYHGKVTRLGGTLTAKCSDCHTPHGNLSADDPASSVHPSRLLDTCSRCHETASAGFVEYHSHGDHHDRENYPWLYWTYKFMTSLLIGVFIFFGLHSFLWLVRVVGGRSRPAREDSA